MKEFQLLIMLQGNMTQYVKVMLDNIQDIGEPITDFGILSALLHRQSQQTANLIGVWRSNTITLQFLPGNKVTGIEWKTKKSITGIYQM